MKIFTLDFSFLSVGTFGGTFGGLFRTRKSFDVLNSFIQKDSLKK